MLKTCMGGQCLKNYLLMVSNGQKKLSQFNEIFIRDYNENNNIEYFLEVDTDYLRKLFNLHNDFPFLPERKK